MNDKIVLIGAGPHAKVVADILIDNHEYEIAGLVDSVNSNGFWGISIIGDDSRLPDIYRSGITKAIIGIGNNMIRRRLFNQAKEIGFEMVNAVSRYAVVSCHISLGTGVAVMPGAIVNADTIIGNGCIINTNCSIDHDNVIGEFSHIAPGSALAGNVRVGAGCFCGVGCRIIDKIEIGHDVIVGAGAVVIKSVESNSTVVGIPASCIKRRK